MFKKKLILKRDNSNTVISTKWVTEKEQGYIYDICEFIAIYTGKDLPLIM